MSLRLSTLVFLTVLAAPSIALADAPIPACSGTQPAAAAKARAEGLRHYRKSKRQGQTDAEMATALSFFDAACAAGDETALELRAYALAGVERFVEAAQTLDAFLAAHPLSSLSEETRARVAAQQPQILVRVASLSVVTPSPGAAVLINHRSVGKTPLAHVRLAPGRYDLEVTVEGAEPITRSLDLAAGDRAESFEPPAPPATVPMAQASDLPPAAPASPASSADLKPWWIGTAIATGVLAAAGVGGAAWASERASTYNGAHCADTSAAGCSSTLSQYNGARGIEIGGFIGAGVAAVATGVLVFLDTRSRNASKAGQGALRCAVPGAGVVCAATF
jgi:hypothetical protein